MEVYFQGRWLTERQQRALLKYLEEKAAEAPPDVREWIQEQMLALDKARSFTCPECHRTSYNENDVQNKYCGACHKFFPEAH